MCFCCTGRKKFFDVNRNSSWVEKVLTCNNFIKESRIHLTYYQHYKLLFLFLTILVQVLTTDVPLWANTIGYSLEPSTIFSLLVLLWWTCGLNWTALSRQMERTGTAEFLVMRFLLLLMVTIWCRFYATMRSNNRVYCCPILMRNIIFLLCQKKDWHPHIF